VKSGRLAATVMTAACTVRGMELVDRWLRSGQPQPADVLIASRSFPALQGLRSVAG
jgi:hypothetical protein